jgi:hypothetical protein
MPQPHYGHIAFNPDTGKVSHLLSGEEVLLGGGPHELHFDAHGMGVLVAEPGSRTLLQDLFSKAAVTQSDGSVQVHDTATNAMSCRPALDFKPDHAYLELTVGRTLVRLLLWRFACYSAGARVWWDLPSASPIFNPTAEHTNTFINNHWPRWLGAFESTTSFPQALGFKKGLDRSGRQADWYRCLREPSASTAGLLSLLSYRGAASIVHDGTRQACRDMFDAVLQATLGAEEFEVTVVLDASAPVYLGFEPKGAACATVAVDHCNVWLEQLVSNATGGLQPLVQGFLGQLCQEYSAIPGTVPLHVLLIATFMDSAFHWLHKQLISEVAVALEAFLPWEDLSQNPLDGTGQIHGTRWDQMLVDHIVLGGGASSSTTDRSSFPGQHAKSFLAVSKDRWKGKKSICVNLAQGSLLARYKEVGAQQFRLLKDIAVACDGSRVGGREIIQFLLVGRTPSGRWTCMWAPPQAFSPDPG